jgi:NitT/TauT family transport system ATP-binding protein
MKLFPLDTGVSEIRGIIEIIRDNSNKIDMSKLAEETNADIDDLFPLVDACSVLGLCTISNGMVKLTARGIELASHNTKELFAQALKKVEPFKSSLEIIGSGKISTAHLTERLAKKGIEFHGDNITNTELLKDLLLKWGVTNHLFSYNPSTDRWSKYRAAH